MISRIRKETGPATWDEMMRFRRRLEELERTAGAKVEALMRTGTPVGPVGGFSQEQGDQRYLMLTAANDPVTGALQLGSTLVVAGATTLQSTLAVTGLVTISSTVHVDPSDDTLPGVEINVGAGFESLEPDEIENAANITLLWVESTDLTTFSDGVTIQNWFNKAPAAVADKWHQSTGSLKPDFYKSNATYITPTGLPGVVCSAGGEYMLNTDVNVALKYGADQGANDVNSAVVLVFRTNDGASTIDRMLGNSGGIKSGFRTSAIDTQNFSLIHNDTGANVSDPPGGAYAHSEWHACLYWYDAADDTHQLWLDGTEISLNPELNLDVEFTIDWLHRNRNSGGTAASVAGAGTAFQWMGGHLGAGLTLTLADAQKVFNFAANKYIGVSAVISGSASGKALDMQIGGVSTTYIDGLGNLVVGGSITGETVISQTAAISGSVTAGSLSVSGLSTLSNTDVEDLTAATLDVAGTSRFRGNITHDGNEFLGTTTTFHCAAIQLNDNAKVRFGDAKDARIYYDGSNLILQPRNVGTGDVIIDQGTGQTIRFGGASGGYIDRATNQNLNIQRLSNGDLFLCRGGGGVVVGSNGAVSGASLTVKAGNAHIVSPYVLEGDRFTEGFGARTVTGTRYLDVAGSAAGTATFGFTAQRSGSIMGIGWAQDAAIMSVHDDVTYEVRVNGAVVFSDTADSTVLSGFATQARGVDTFAAGDIINVAVTMGGSFNGTINITTNVDIIYDD